MKIAICDDNEKCRSNIYQILMKCGGITLDTPIKQFSNGTELVNDYRKHQGFDIVFLDIEMPELPGIEAGHEIRKIDKDVMIVYLTSHEHYMRTSFKVEAFDFLVKPSSIDEVNDVIIRAFKKYHDQHYFVDIRWNGSHTRLMVNEIVYLWGYYGKVIFYTETDDYQCIGSLKKYENELYPYGFLKCHKNYIVNMKYIKIIEDKKVMTTTGITVDMSLRLKKECLKKLSEYYRRYDI